MVQRIRVAFLACAVCFAAAFAFAGESAQRNPPKPDGGPREDPYPHVLDVPGRRAVFVHPDPGDKPLKIDVQTAPSKPWPKRSLKT